MNYDEEVLSIVKEDDIEMLNRNIRKLAECDSVVTFCCQLYAISDMCKRMHDILRPYVRYPDLIDYYIRNIENLSDKSS